MYKETKDKEAKERRLQHGRHTLPLLSLRLSNLLGILCAPELRRCRDKNTNLTEDIYDIYSRKKLDSGYFHQALYHSSTSLAASELVQTWIHLPFASRSTPRYRHYNLYGHLLSAVKTPAILSQNRSVFQSQPERILELPQSVLGRTLMH